MPHSVSCQSSTRCDDAPETVRQNFARRIKALFGAIQPVPADLYSGRFSSQAYSRKSFLVAGQDIERIVMLVSGAIAGAYPDRAQAVQVRAWSRHKELDLISPAGLTAYENPDHCPLSEIHVAIADAEERTGALVAFRDDPVGWSIGVHVGGDDAEFVSSLRERLDMRMSELHAWYWPLSENRFWAWLGTCCTALATLIVLLWTVVMIGASWHGTATGPLGVTDSTIETSSGIVHVTRPATPADVTARGVSREIVRGVGALMVFCQVFPLRRLVFPKAAFLIGRGHRRHEVIRVWQRVLIAGFAIALVLVFY